MTNAATGATNVRALVYVAAFIPDKYIVAPVRGQVGHVAQGPVHVALHFAQGNGSLRQCPILIKNGVFGIFPSLICQPLGGFGFVFDKSVSVQVADLSEVDAPNAGKEQTLSGIGENTTPVIQPDLRARSSSRGAARTRPPATGAGPPGRRSPAS